MIKVSDYKLVSFLLDSICESMDCSFVDLPIEFDKNDIGLQNGKLNIAKSDTWQSTVFNIVSLYLENFETICGKPLLETREAEDSIIMLWHDFVVRLSYNDNLLDESRSEEPVLIRLYQCPNLWLLMKNLICPSYQIVLNNLQLAIVHSSHCDISAYIDNDEMLIKDEPFIIVNKDVECVSVRDAFLFVSVLKAHDMEVEKVIRDMLYSELKDPFVSLLKLFYDEKGVNDFIFVLAAHIDENKVEELLIPTKSAFSKGTHKYSQAREGGLERNNLTNSFWYFGLIEQMLAPMREADWSTYQRLNPWFEELRKKINIAKQKVGRSGLTYEALLRVRSGENDEDSVNILEKTLASDRVW